MSVRARFRGFGCRKASAAVIALVVGLSVTNAHADPGTADTLFRAARAAKKGGDEQRACRLFAESYRLDPALGTQLNLALCEEQRGNLAHALQMLQEVHVVLPASDPRRVIAAEHLQDLELRVSWLVLQIGEGATDDVRVRVGDAELSSASFGVRLPVDPGRRTLIVRAPRHADRNYELEFSPGSEQTLTVEPGQPLEVRSAPPEPRKQTRSNARHVAGVVTLGLAGSALTTSLALGLATLNAKQSMDGACDTAGSCSVAGVEAAERGQRLALASELSFAVGLAAGGVAAYLLLWEGSSARQAHRTSHAMRNFDLRVGVSQLSLSLKF
jgi:hypothetical protein